MAKKIAVIIRDRQEEALRMALGLILMDDVIDIFVIDGKVKDSETVSTNIETMKDMDMDLYTNCRDNDNMEYLATEEIAQQLLGYDIVLPY
jgi:hypothetical protein